MNGRTIKFMMKRAIPKLDGRKRHLTSSSVNPYSRPDILFRSLSKKPRRIRPDANSSTHHQLIKTL